MVMWSQVAWRLGGPRASRRNRCFILARNQTNIRLAGKKWTARQVKGPSNSQLQNGEILVSPIINQNLSTLIDLCRIEGSVFVLILRQKSSSSSSELGQVKYIWTVFVLDFSWPTSWSLLANYKLKISRQSSFQEFDQVSSKAVLRFRQKWKLRWLLKHDKNILRYKK